MENTVSVKFTGDSNSLNNATASGDKGLEKLGVTAKQTAAAMRGVPAQFTDIVTSIQGGQAPLTVLLQQGGQLKDMFGGIGPAARALSTYIFGLINPYTILAGTLGVVGAAYYAGSEQSKRLENALITSGNVIGKTSGELETLAETVGRATGHYTESREAVEALASSGVISGSQLETALKGVTAYAQLTGKSVDELVPKFEEIARNPVKAIVKLNDQYNFLTVDIYKQIKALEESGEKTEAAQLAMETFANAMDDRKGQIVENVGFIESAWNKVKAAIDGAKDSILSIGREDSLDAQIAKAKQQLAGFEATRAQASSSSPKDILDRLDSKIVAQKSILDELTRQNNTAKFLADDAAKTMQQQKDAINKLEVDSKKTPKVDQDAAAADRFIESLKKQTETLGMSKAEMLAYEAAHLKLSDAQKKLAADFIGTQKSIENQKQAAEDFIQKYEAQQKIYRETADASQKQAQADLKNAEKKQSDFETMNERYRIQNEDLNVSLIKDDAKRAKAQIDLEHERSLDRINTLQLEAEQAQVLIEQETDHYEKELKKIEQKTKSTGDKAKELGLTFNSALENTLVKGGSLGDMLDGLGQDVERMIYRILVIEPLLQSIKSVISDSGIGDIFGSIVGSIFGGSDGGYTPLPDFVPANHTGGIVGLESTFHRAVSPNVFKGAPRFHTGGIVGDEVPSILTRGEGVFTQEQMKNLAPASSTGMNIQVNLIESPNSGKAGKVEATQSDTGKTLNIYVEQITAKMSSDIARGAGLAQQLESTYGLNRAAGGR